MVEVKENKMKTDKTGLEQYLEWMNAQPGAIIAPELWYKGQALLAEEKAAMEKAQGQRDGVLNDKSIMLDQKFNSLKEELEAEGQYRNDGREWLDRENVMKIISRHLQPVEAQKPTADKCFLDEIYAYTKKHPEFFWGDMYAIMNRYTPTTPEKPAAPALLVEAIEKFATQYGGIPGRELINMLDDYRPIPSTDNPREDCVQKGIEEMITEGGV